MGDGETPLTVKDAVDCAGVPRRECGGNGSTCCVNYCDVPDLYWDFMLLPVTLDNVIEKLEMTYEVVNWISDNVPDCDNVTAEDAETLQVGRMAEFNRIFIDDCLDEFGRDSGNIYAKLVVDSYPVAVHHEKRSLQLTDI